MRLDLRHANKGEQKMTFEDVLNYDSSKSTDDEHAIYLEELEANKPAIFEEAVNHPNFAHTTVKTYRGNTKDIVTEGVYHLDPTSPSGVIRVFGRKL